MTSTTIPEKYVDQAASLAANCVDVLPAGELAARLEKADREGRPLRVKFGMDPTSPDIHLGHCVPLKKLREFQDAGHLVVLIVGDYTARVGDPSGRSKTRPVLSGEEIDANARTYQEQAFRVLDPDRVEIRYNGEWFSKMSMADIFALMRLVTVARIMERDDFTKRFESGEPISMLELLYPIMQGYDSVMVDADIEFGGTDQLYNLLMGRAIQPEYGQEPQLVMTVPILTGTDGTEKMSKSYGNHIGVTDSPEEMFGRTMSIPDELMPEYYRLATALAPEEAEEYVAGILSGSTHPNHAKRSLGRFIVERFYDTNAAEAAEQHFDRLFRDHAAPEDMPQVSVAAIALNDGGRVFLPAFLVEHLGVASNGEARRLIQQGGVRLDGEPLDASDLEVAPEVLTGHTLQVGKRRFLRIVP